MVRMLHLPGKKHVYLVMNYFNCNELFNFQGISIILLRGIVYARISRIDKSHSIWNFAFQIVTI